MEVVETHSSRLDFLAVLEFFETDSAVFVSFVSVHEKILGFQSLDLLRSHPLADLAIAFFQLQHLFIAHIVWILLFGLFNNSPEHLLLLVLLVGLALHHDVHHHVPLLLS